jgi:hypothetical protein
MVVAPEVDVDQTTGGLNFATVRPRTVILRDQARVFRHIYHPATYYERALCTATHLRPSHRYRPSLARALKLAWAFLRVSIRAGLDRRTGLLYWKTLFNVLVRNPRAAGAVVSMAALYVHYAKQSEFVIRTLEDRAAYVESYGEEQYSQSMMGGQFTRVGLERRSLGQQKIGSGVGIPQPSTAGGMT